MVGYEVEEWSSLGEAKRKEILEAEVEKEKEAKKRDEAQALLYELTGRAPRTQRTVEYLRKRGQSYEASRVEEAIKHDADLEARIKADSSSHQAQAVSAKQREEKQRSGPATSEDDGAEKQAEAESGRDPPRRRPSRKGVPA